MCVGVCVGVASKTEAHVLCSVLVVRQVSVLLPVCIQEEAHAGGDPATATCLTPHLSPTCPSLSLCRADAASSEVEGACRAAPGGSGGGGVAGRGQEVVGWQDGVRRWWGGRTGSGGGGVAGRGQEVVGWQDGVRRWWGGRTGSGGGGVAGRGQEVVGWQDGVRRWWGGRTGSGGGGVAGRGQEVVGWQDGVVLPSTMWLCLSRC